MGNNYKDTTLNYYNEQFEKFAGSTKDLEFSEIQDYFLHYVKPGSLVLDFGCGSGRDSRYFLQKGYRVEAIDGSEKMVRIARETAGIPVKQMLFNELDEVEKYDGIFCCASILHVPSAELPDIMIRLRRAVKMNGIVYVSFKYGDFEGYRNGRYFTDLKEDSFQKLLDTVGGFEILDTRISTDARPGRDDEKWLNVMLRRIA